MRLAEIAQQAEDGETDGSPWLVLAAHLRTLMARLEPREPSTYAELRARAEAAATRALAEGSAEDRADLAERLTAIADNYAGKQPTYSPAARLADDLRVLVAHLRSAE